MDSSAALKRTRSDAAIHEDAWSDSDDEGVNGNAHLLLPNY